MCFLLKKTNSTKSNYAVPGLYFMIIQWHSIAKIAPQQGEYEITDVNKEHLRQAEIESQGLDRGQLG
jgi:dTDP-glucose pyrophosphorylase